MSNLVSALLVSSNPTNLILTSAFGLSFLQYSAWLALPTLAGAVVLFPILRFVVFRGERMIPRTLSPPKVDPKSALVDPLGGIFGASLFLVTIVCLVSLSAGGLLEGVEGVWTVTAPAALIMLVRDCVHDVIVRKRDEERREKEELVRVKEGREKVDIKALGDFTSDREKGVSERGEPKNETGDTITGPLDDGAQASGNDVTGVGQDRDDGRKADRATLSEEVGGGDDQARDSNDAIKESKLNASMSLSDAGPGTSERGQSAGTNVSPARSPGPPLLHSLSDTFPTPALILTRLPLPLIPFAFSMFILVEALQHTGWIRVFGGWWAAWVRAGGTAGSVWLMGTIGGLGCNVELPICIKCCNG